jgi:hypothetical protein
VFVEPLDRNFWVDTEEVVAIEAAIGSLDPVQAFLGDRDGVVDVLDVLRTSHRVVVHQGDQRRHQGVSI